MAESTFTEPTGVKPAPKGIGGKGGTGLKKVMFGMPLWVWLIIVAVAIGLAVYIRSQSATDTSVGEEIYDDPGVTPDYGTGDVGGSGADVWDDFEDYDPETDTTEKQSDPDIQINVNGGKKPAVNTTGGKVNCGDKPKNPAGKGFHWKCVNGNWTRVKNTAAQNKKQDAKIKAAQKKKQEKKKGKDNKNVAPISASPVSPDVVIAHADDPSKATHNVAKVDELPSGITIRPGTATGAIVGGGPPVSQPTRTAVAPTFTPAPAAFKPASKTTIVSTPKKATPAKTVKKAAKKVAKKVKKK